MDQPNSPPPPKKSTPPQDLARHIYPTPTAASTPGPIPPPKATTNSEKQRPPTGVVIIALLCIVFSGFYLWAYLKYYIDDSFSFSVSTLTSILLNISNLTNLTNLLLLASGIGLLLLHDWARKIVVLITAFFGVAIMGLSLLFAAVNPFGYIFLQESEEKAFKSIAASIITIVVSIMVVSYLRSPIKNVFR